MGLQHPDITAAIRTGYPRGVKEPQEIGFDSLGNEILEGDTIYELNDEIFVIEELGFESRRILEKLGANREIAQ